MFIDFPEVFSGESCGPWASWWICTVLTLVQRITAFMPSWRFNHKSQPPSHGFQISVSQLLYHWRTMTVSCFRYCWKRLDIRSIFYDRTLKCHNTDISFQCHILFIFKTFDLLIQIAKIWNQFGFLEYRIWIKLL